jgi:hypothetical protein
VEDEECREREQNGEKNEVGSPLDECGAEGQREGNSTATLNEITAIKFSQLCGDSAVDEPAVEVRENESLRGNGVGGMASEQKLPAPGAEREGAVVGGECQYDISQLRPNQQPCDTRKIQPSTPKRHPDEYRIRTNADDYPANNRPSAAKRNRRDFLSRRSFGSH